MGGMRPCIYYVGNHSIRRCCSLASLTDESGTFPLQVSDNGFSIGVGTTRATLGPLFGADFMDTIWLLVTRVMDYDEACFMHLTPGVVHNFPKAVGVQDFCPLCTKSSQI